MSKHDAPTQPTLLPCPFCGEPARINGTGMEVLRLRAASARRALRDRPLGVDMRADYSRSAMQSKIARDALNGD